MTVADAILRVRSGRSLDEIEMSALVGELMTGGVDSEAVGAFLLAMREKGESAQELAGAARAMLERAVPFARANGTVVDTCGTGGDQSGSINVSTIAALVVAGAGVSVAKHGNRASSSRSGLADVLEALGVSVDVSPERAAENLRVHNFAFLFAPRFHPATKQVAAVRRSLGVRTLFNLLGPLTNPARPTVQVVGVPEAKWLPVMAEALRMLGREHAWVVHGEGGLDELSPAGTTEIAIVTSSGILRRAVGPGDFGLAAGDPAALAGGDAAYNAERARAILDGERSAARTAIVMAAASAIHLATGQALVEATREAERSLDERRAARVLEAIK